MIRRARPAGARRSPLVVRSAVPGLVAALLLAGCASAGAHPDGGPVVSAATPDRPTAVAASSSTPTPTPTTTTSTKTTTTPATTPGTTPAPTPTVTVGTVGPLPAPSTADPTAQALTTPAVAVSYAGSSDVGALFSGSTAGAHGCSASVVDSPGRDLLVTAAHCVSGSGSGLEFVPGYLDGANPYGTWSVDAAFADPSWISEQDPTADVVFLRVEPHLSGSGRTVEIEDVVGAATLGAAPAEGTAVTVDGYAAGAYDRPITCTADVSETAGYPTFGCGGFVAGTSGGPWLAPVDSGGSPRLVGIIGGLNQGGCSDDISYSPPFGSTVMALWLRACAGGDPDSLPVPGPDGC